MENGKGHAWLWSLGNNRFWTVVEVNVLADWHL
jgi:hypothetical protein